MAFESVWDVYNKAHHAKTKRERRKWYKKYKKAGGKRKLPKWGKG